MTELMNPTLLSQVAMSGAMPMPAAPGGLTYLARRPGLVERVQRAGAVCAVVAPPGFGKTILAEQLTAARPGARVVGAEAFDALSDSAPPLLAIDDAHTMSREALGRALQWAEGAGVEQLVLMGRPSLEAILRDVLGERRVEVIRANRLAFELDETREFLLGRALGELTEDVVQELHGLAAGWPALLECAVPPGTTEREINALLQRDEPPRAAMRLATGSLLSDLSDEARADLARACVLRRLDDQAVAAVLGDEARATALLQTLREADLVVPGADGSPRLRAPWVREALRRSLEEREPETVRRGQHAAAEYLRQARVEWAVPDVIAHYVEAREWSAAASFLDANADGLLERVAAERAQRWLASVEEQGGAMTLPSVCLQGRVFSLLGQSHQAESALVRAQTEFRNIVATKPKEEPLAFARVSWLQAVMAMQRGRANEASAYGQRALAALREYDRGVESVAVDAMVFDLLRLDARLMVEAGKHDAAEAALRQLVDRAERTHRRRAQATAHFELGKLSLRTGDALRAVDHLTSALELVDRQTDSDLYGQLETARAQAHLPRGEYEDARSSIANALSVRRRLGHLPSMARTLVTLAELRIADGQSETADAPFKEAIDVLRHGADNHLRAEVVIRYANYLVDMKRVGDAIRLLERVREFVGELRRFDPALAALADAARGRIARLQSRVSDAHTLLLKAAESLSRQGADHLAAQAWLWLAEAHWTDPPQHDAAAPIRRYTDAACSLANRREYVFGQAERYLPIIASASALGSLEATQYLRRIRGEAPDPRDYEAIGRLTGIQQERYRVFGPDGERMIRADELNEILGAMRPEHLAVVSREGRCDIHHRGQVQSGDLKRVVLPLLRVLMQHPGKGLSAPELAREVWNETEFNQKARTKLKVAVSRLRELLGADAKHLQTMPGSGPDRAANTRYALDTSLAFLWIESVELN